MIVHLRHTLLLVSDLVILLSVCRTALLRLCPVNWLIPTFWKSGNVFRCAGWSLIIRGGLLKKRGSPSPMLQSDLAMRWEENETGTIIVLKICLKGL